MCTVIGWKGSLTTAALRHLIGMSYEYGPHSTGVAYSDQAGRTRVYKKAKHPHAFLRDHNATIKAASSSVVGIAHTRFGSVGKLTDGNAHPFNHKGLVYCHNGTISNWREINPKVSSDSQVLGPLLASQEMWKASGTAGLTWIQDGELHAYRRAKPLTAVTFYREKPLTVVATYSFMIPKWLWEFKHEVHDLRELAAYRFVDGVAEIVWEEP